MPTPSSNRKSFRPARTSPGTSRVYRSALTQRRHKLIDEGWRLTYDPFKVAVSESDAAFNFARIYVDPPLVEPQPGLRQEPLRERLKAPRHSFVFANYGMGKTATSLALAYELREAYGHNAPPTLHVTYQPGFRGTAPASPEAARQQHLAQIARHTTTDLVIQTLERLSERLGGAETLTLAERTALARQLNAAPQSLRLVLRHLASGKAQPDKLWGVLRPTVRPEIATAGWFADVRALVAPYLTGTTSTITLDDIIADARALGFGPIFISLDALDDATLSAEVLRQRIEPLLPLLPTWQNIGMYFKCFLPVGLSAYFESEFRKQYAFLTPFPDLATIADSTPEHLMEILDRRLQAATTADSYLKSLDDLRGPDVRASITQTLAEAAGGSPRDVLELAARLVEFHSNHGYTDGKRPWINADEWLAFLREIDASGVAPPR